LAFVGAGGKTTALFTLARELVETPRRGVSTTSLVSTTTHLGLPQAAHADHHLRLATPEDVEALEVALPQGVLLITGEPNAEGRLLSPSPGVMDRLRLLTESRRLPFLIEADGARTLSLKAPASHEPAIPPFADTVVVVAGLSALGEPLSPEWVHRPEIFSSLSGLSLGDPITHQALVAVLAHPQGGLKNIPATARRLVLLNQADTPALQSIAGSLSGSLLESYHAVIVASLSPSSLTPHPTHFTPLYIHAVHERIAGIILAAGESLRFGQPKPLLLWRGESFIRHSIRAAQGAGLSPVIVVGGKHMPQLRLACAGTGVELVYNPDWQAGQSTSIHAGLAHLPPETGAAVFLLADQPQAPAELVRSLVEIHASGLHPIVVPQADGQRSNPVLFDRITFPDLQALQGDVGGRVLFSKFPIAWLPWHDPSILLDVDTPRDYERLLTLE
jgi:molybdenum cofactor cytidylyltransferase